MSAPASAAFITSYPPASIIFRSASTVNAGKASLIAFTACRPSLITIGVPISTISINSATSETISFAPSIFTRSSANCSFIYSNSFSIYLSKCFTHCRCINSIREVGTLPCCSYPKDTIVQAQVLLMGAAQKIHVDFFRNFRKNTAFS
ncbi:hypothetical protein D3C75_738380 [compost metagenome]